MLSHNNDYHAYLLFAFYIFLTVLVVAVSYTPYDIQSGREELHERMSRIEDFTKWLSEQPDEVQDEYKNIIRRGIEKRINKTY